MGHGFDALLRLNVTMFGHGVNCMNSFWFRSKPTTTSATLQDECDFIVNDFKVQIWPLYAACMSNEFQLFASVCQVMSPPGTAMTVVSYTGQNGLVNSESLPSHCASVIGMYTAYSGRRTHGRLYIPGVPEIEHTGSIVSNAQAVKLAAIASKLISFWGSNGTSPKVWGGVFSRKNGVVRLPGPPPVLSYSPLAHIPWTRSLINVRVRTQRHRMQGRGV